MKLRTGKNVIGALVLGLHSLAIILSFALLRPQLATNDFHLVILILVPITSVYALPFLREVTKTMMAGAGDADDSGEISTRFMVVGVLMILLFSGPLLYTIYDFANGAAQSPDDLQISLSTIEVAFGAFTGLFVEALFGKLPPVTNLEQRA